MAAEAEEGQDTSRPTVDREARAPLVKDSEDKFRARETRGVT